MGSNTFSAVLVFIFVSWFKGVPFHQIKTNDAHVPHDKVIPPTLVVFPPVKLKRDVQQEKRAENDNKNIVTLENKTFYPFGHKI